MAKMTKRKDIRNKVKHKRNTSKFKHKPKTVQRKEITLHYSAPKDMEDVEACQARVRAGQKCYCNDVCRCRNCDRCVGYGHIPDDCNVLCRECNLHIPCKC